MKKTISIKRNNDFIRLYRRGKSDVAGVLVTYCSRNRRGMNRIGITATKKVGGAVQRNRAKRVIRAAYTALEQELPQGWDFIFVARSRTAHCRMQSVEEAMRQQILGLTAPKPSTAAPPEAGQ